MKGAETLSKIITDNLNEEFSKIRSQKVTASNGAKIVKNPSGVTMGKSSLIDKSEIPNNVQRKMKKNLRLMKLCSRIL